MMKNIMKLIVLMLLMLPLFPQNVFAKSHAQINSTAIDKEGAFLSWTVAHFIVTGPNVRRLGGDPVTKQIYREVDEEFEGGYGTTGIDDIEGAEAGLELIDGDYIIEVIGNGLDLMAFDIGVSILRDVGGEGFADSSFIGITDKGMTSKFRMTYNSDPNKPAGGLVRLATTQSLKQDIELSRKVNWIDNDGIMKSLLKKAEAIEDSINRGNSRAAENELKALINEVEAQTEKHIGKEASTILIEDAQYIIDNL